MNSVCFVTEEIMPFTMGGIGAFARNILDTYSGRCEHYYVLYVGDLDIDLCEWNLRFPHVKLFKLTDISPEAVNKWSSLKPAHRLVYKSALIKEILIELNRQFKFTYIEFVDWGGAGFFTIQTKHAGIDFDETILVVRLHTTEGVLRNFESRPWGKTTAKLIDFERKALADADLIVAHIWPVVKSVQKSYGFDDAWLSKAVINLPPVYTPFKAAKTVQLDVDRQNIVFTSKLQEIKKPTVLVHAAVMFLRKNVSFGGKIIFCAFEPVPGWRNRLLDLIPDDLKGKFVFLPFMESDKRNKLISESIVVFPNAYEAFCFAAYEASIMGGYCVLNAENPAFGLDTPWIEEKNCIKFNGTASSLSDTLSRIFRQNGSIPRLSPVDIRHEENPYWSISPKFASLTKVNTSVSFIITTHCSAASLKKTVLGILKYEYDVAEIFVLARFSTDPDLPLVLEALEKISKNDKRLKIAIADNGINDPVLINSVLEQCSGDTTVILPAECDFLPGFFTAAANALHKSSFYDLVLPISSLYRLDEHGVKTHVDTFLPIGEGLISNLLENFTAAHAFVCKSYRMKKYSFCEDLNSHYEWHFILGLIQQGSKAIVWPDLCLEYDDAKISQLAPKDLAEFQHNTEIVRRSATWSSASGGGNFLALCDVVENNTPTPNVRSETVQHNPLDNYRSAYNKIAKKKIDLLQEVLRRLSGEYYLSFYVNIERIDGGIFENNIWEVQSPDLIQITGWWRPKYALRSEVEVKCYLAGGGRNVECRFQRQNRFDVAAEFSIPNDVDYGFICSSEETLLPGAKYVITFEFRINSKLKRVVNAGQCRVVL
ncbi:hypothetical protein [Methylobacterium brachiatum]|uniref:hypothetical protein n=1 Tax=Methylobacterium brachiatum TaxID=269660 RepID=UPI003315A669